MSLRCDKKYAGFTLLEVMVAIAILSFLMTMVWSSQRQSIRAKTRIETREAIYHQAAVALRKISDDLTMAFLAKKEVAKAAETAPGATPTPAPQPTSSTQEALKTFLIGQDRGDRDILRFTSFSNMRLFKNAKESDQCKIMYEITQSKKDQDTYDLVRRQEAWLDATNEVKATPNLMAEGVKSLNIEYYDIKKNEWKKEWDTDKIDWKDTLPAAVNIKMGFADPYDEKKTLEFTTSVMIPMSKGPVEY